MIPFYKVTKKGRELLNIYLEDPTKIESSKDKDLCACLATILWEDVSRDTFTMDEITAKDLEIQLAYIPLMERADLIGPPSLDFMVKRFEKEVVLMDEAVERRKNSRMGLGSDGDGLIW